MARLGESITRAEKLANDLADEILRGGFLPGARLDEMTLAERYGVSRTPVREALRQLASTGLIETRARRGAIVSSVDNEMLSVLFVAMGEIEATCARLSALSMNPIERRRLTALHDSMEKLASPRAEVRYAEANRDFHLTIYAGSHNSALVEIAMGLRRRLDPFRRAQFRAAGRLKRSHAEHGVVVAAIAAGDAAAAHAAMLEHVHSVSDAFGSLRAEPNALAV